MTTISIDNDCSLYYEDTGIPDIEDNYTTYICIHGYAHDLRTFNPFVQHAPKSVRLIRFNGRSYNGSSELPTQIRSLYETRGISRSDSVALTEVCSADLAKFILAISKKCNLSKKSINLLAHSQGCSWVVGVIGDHIDRDQPLYDDALSYVSQFTLVDPPASSWDLTMPKGYTGFNPFGELKFEDYAGGHWLHEYGEDGLILKSTPTFSSNLSQTNYYDPKIVQRIPPNLFHIDPVHATKVVARALRGESGHSDITGSLVGCGNTLQECEFCCSWISTITKGGPRDWNVLWINNANHFVISNQPQAFWKYLGALETKLDRVEPKL
ncbi:4-hydroxy-3-methylbut-2-enyl diphosphate reductase [Acrasis kona]|uniref:4-hydroxy-3-methylbut-2-enyl diphosphate reductase n=1 Tax=Acrasis kona TaxID=1008807 RepID=A0AAW2ZKP6_9EUKA